mgnify:CR=1 FL=1
MDISRTLKDVILITPWLLCLLVYSVTLGFIHLFLLFISNLIFIYESINNGNKYEKRKT